MRKYFNTPCVKFHGPMWTDFNNIVIYSSWNSEYNSGIVKRFFRNVDGMVLQKV